MKASNCPECNSENIRRAPKSMGFDKENLCSDCSHNWTDERKVTVDTFYAYQVCGNMLAKYARGMTRGSEEARKHVFAELSAEMTNLLDLWRKSTDVDPQDRDEELLKQQVLDEAGHLLFWLSRIASEFDFTLQELAENDILKRRNK